MSQRPLKRILLAVGRWTAQVLVGLLALVATALICLTLGLRLAYPEDSLKELALELVNRNLYGEVELGRLYLSPLSGLVVRELRVLSSPEFDRIPAVVIDELVLAYDLPRFLSQKVLVVETCAIGGLHLHLVEHPELGWNVENLAPPSEVEPDPEPFHWGDVPVRLRISRIGVYELSLLVENELEASLGGLSLELSGLQTDRRLPMKLRLQKAPGPVVLRLGPRESAELAAVVDELAFNFDLTLERRGRTAAVSGGYYLRAAGLNLEAPLRLAPEGTLSARGDFSLNLDERRIGLSLEELALGDYLRVGLEMGARLGENPRVALRLRELFVNLRPLVAELGPLLPPLSASGIISGGAEIELPLDRGLERAEVKTQLSLDNVYAALPAAGIEVHGLNARLGASGVVRLDDPRPALDLDVEASILSASQGPFSAAGLRLRAVGRLDSAAMRVEGLRTELSLQSVVGELDGAPVALSNLSLGALLDADLEAGDLSARGLTLRLGDALAWNGSLQARGFGSRGAQLQFDDFHADTARLLFLVPPGLVELPPIYPYGVLRLRGGITLAPGALEAADPVALARLVDTNLQLQLSNGGVATPEGGVDGVQLSMGFSLIEGDGAVGLELDIAEVVADLDQDLRDISFRLVGDLQNLEELTIETLTLNVPSLDTHLEVHGGVSNLLGLPDIALQLSARVGRIGEPLPINTGPLQVYGQLGLELVVTGSTTGRRPIELDGRLRFHQLHASQPPLFNLRGLDGELPIRQGIVPTRPFPLLGSREAAVSPFVDRRYELLKPFTPEPNLRIERITAGDQEVEDLELTWELTGGVLRIWRLGMKTLDGDIGGEVHLHLDREEPRYQIRLVFGGVNLGRLVKGLEADESSAINGDLTLRGEGFDLMSDFNVEGSINITSIGRRVVDRMLMYIDPEGANPSITSVRSLLGQVGRQPKLLLMDIRNQALTIELHIENTGFSLLALFTSFIDISRIVIPRIPVGTILERIAADTQVAAPAF